MSLTYSSRMSITPPLGRRHCYYPACRCWWVRLRCWSTQGWIMSQWRPPIEVIFLSFKLNFVSPRYARKDAEISANPLDSSGYRSIQRPDS